MVVFGFNWEYPPSPRVLGYCRCWYVDISRNRLLPPLVVGCAPPPPPFHLLHQVPNGGGGRASPTNKMLMGNPKMYISFFEHQNLGAHAGIPVWKSWIHYWTLCLNSSFVINLLLCYKSHALLWSEMHKAFVYTIFVHIYLKMVLEICQDNFSCTSAKWCFSKFDDCIALSTFTSVFLCCYFIKQDEEQSSYISFKMLVEI